MNVFPSNPSVPALGQSFIVYVDPACQVKAALFDLNGHPLPGAQAVVVGGLIQSFQAAPAALYARDTAGQVETLYAHAAATKPVVTGSKGANAALTSVVAALAQLGIIVDTTS